MCYVKLDRQHKVGGQELNTAHRRRTVFPFQVLYSCRTPGHRRLGIKKPRNHGAVIRYVGVLSTLIKRLSL